MPEILNFDPTNPAECVAYCAGIVEDAEQAIDTWLGNLQDLGIIYFDSKVVTAGNALLDVITRQHYALGIAMAHIVDPKLRQRHERSCHGTSDHDQN